MLALLFNRAWEKINGRRPPICSGGALAVWTLCVSNYHYTLDGTHRRGMDPHFGRTFDRGAVSGISAAATMVEVRYLREIRASLSYVRTESYVLMYCETRSRAE